MSKAELDQVIVKVQKEFSAWGPNSTIAELRESSERLFGQVNDPAPASIELVDAAGVQACWITAPGVSPDRVVLFLHGGGYLMGSIDSHRDLMARISAAADARVLGLNYRLAPEHPYPAGLEDTRTAYQWLMDNGAAAERTVIVGDSAGGGLAVGAMLTLGGSGLPMPAACVLMSPWLDPECSSESMRGGVTDDPMVIRDTLRTMAALYLNGATPSGLADWDLRGLPPTLVQVGRRELLVDEALLFAHRARGAGVDVTIEVWPGMIHVWQIFASELEEGREAIEVIGSFVRKHTG